MEMVETKFRWQDWVNLILGVWLFIAPFFGIGAVYSAAAVNGYIFGAIIVAFSLYALYTGHVWEEWINMAIGIWLVFAPLALGFYGLHVVMLNHVDVGAALFGIALWATVMHTPYEHEPKGDVTHHA